MRYKKKYGQFDRLNETMHVKIHLKVKNQLVKKAEHAELDNSVNTAS